ncbi:MAG: CDP-diacylglycerol--glycerol-3-phosphate 3-phosphatidyltransferase [Thiofilum sp.]|uniref:CDP-diacylglycerol--glycerol-3-phosphate 3-phosphatidyltransferase n=1 Tax=Thiofilum sp. TaxID=2212733 RepID=UPI0025DDA311|nr:CDP-diacylglycerol--glycerol-3-phosphate 3-phosphatidyltransferase [Thiofilum sp.]MBK8455201.1 CDP-diacylglycerol--glycerol-3-phosphate 3-phosphatidyltransferase [Thiofilum sp.]
MVLNLPVMLTWLRIALIPVLIGFFYLPTTWASLAAALTFSIAGITDWADGYYARKYQLESGFGAFLDPVADKLIVAVALILIVEREGHVAFTLAASVIIAREIIISALREWMAKLGSSQAVAVAYIGKLKTTAQIIALICLLYNQNLWFLPAREIGIAALLIATVLTLVSMGQYLKAAYPVLAKHS